MNNAPLLTCTGFGFTLLTTGNQPGGRENPFFRTGENRHSLLWLFYARHYVRLCAVYSLWRVCFWEALRLAAPVRGILTPKPQPAAYAVRSIIGGYSLLKNRITRMNTQDTHAQNPEQTTHELLTVDFKHRLSAFPRINTNGLTDSISLMTGRALGILYLLSGQFDGSSDRLADEILGGAINAAINEVADIQATVEAYLEAGRAQAAGLANPKA